MKKFIMIVFVMLIVLSNIIPAMAFAEDVKTPPPVKPYEKVVAKNGNWYSEQIKYDGNSNLVTGYLGEYVNDGSNKEIIFEIKEDIVLSGISLPFIGQSMEPIIIKLQDEKGNIFDNLQTEKVISNVLGGKAGADFDIYASEKISYVYNSDNNIVLQKGQYTMTLNSSDKAVGTFMIKGMNYSAYERYKKDLIEWELQNNNELSENIEIFQTFGNEKFIKEDLDKYKNNGFENPPTKNPIVFNLDSEYMIDEIIINTYNDGYGEKPGIISISNESGEIVLSEQAYGGSLLDVANGMWKIAPNIVFGAGNYFISIANPEILSYDEAGEPLFYVKASIPVSIRYDFTGTYSINLDTYKTRTLMGLVSSQESSFSVKDFELTVLDKQGEIQLIGKYEDIPFSQGCEIIEETVDFIVAKFDFAADLTKLPYKVKIGADARVTLIKPENGDATINIEGIGTFKREATKEKGADDNEYSIVSNGTIKQKELPLFVMTALGKSSDAGNIPGPDNATQAATGMLFPPLVGLVVASLQDILKPKVKVKAKAKAAVRDKGWYKTNNPNLSDEQLAMVMLADAMGGTDNPDEGDAISVGDNEKPGGSDYEVNDDNEETGDETLYEEESGTDSQTEIEQNVENEPQSQKSENENQLNKEKPEEPQKTDKIEVPEEPEEMVLQTSANGATSRYVKDPSTGEWVNAETGGILDYDKYKETAEKQFADDKKFNDDQFDKMSKGETEHDKILREEMQKIKDKEKLGNYQNKMKSKYGTDNIEDINTIIKAKEVLDRESFKRWQNIGDFNAAGEVGATVVGAVADTAIDGLSGVTPGGNYIKAGYKATKGIAGTMAEKGVSKASLYEGTIKGVTDAALDAEYFKNNPFKKAIITAAGEAVGSAVGDANRPDGDWLKAGTEGAIDGVFKVAVGTITDKVAGDANIVLPKGTPKFLPTMKNVLVNKSSASKVGGTLTDEFYVKPKGVNPIKKIVIGK